MASSEQGDKQREREIARNEAERQAVGDIRVSAWTIVFAIIIAVIVVAIVWAWFGR
jgi:heme/copper-type cytochrome/quinol oxidase subunit 2